MEAKKTDSAPATPAPSLLSITKSSCGRYHVLTNRVKKYSVEIPEDWRITTNFTSDFGMEFSAYKFETSFATNVNFIMSQKEAGRSLAHLVDEQKNQLTAVGMSNISTGRIDARGRCWEVLSGDNTRVPMPNIKVKTHITQTDFANFFFTFSYQQNRLRENEEAVKHMVETLRPI